jgi:hypothetical protein
MRPIQVTLNKISASGSASSLSELYRLYEPEAVGLTGRRVEPTPRRAELKGSKFELFSIEPLNLLKSFLI